MPSCVVAFLLRVRIVWQLVLVCLVCVRVGELVGHGWLDVLVWLVVKGVMVVLD